MTEKYDAFPTAAILWAAERLKMDADRIGEVSFELMSGCDHVGQEAEIVALIEVRGYSRAPKIRYRTVTVDAWDLEKFLGRIANIASEMQRLLRGETTPDP